MKTATPDFRREYPKDLIYVAHSGESAKYTKYIMRFIYECGCIPLSIFEAYDYWFQVEFYRGHKALCLHDDISVMLRCDELWIFGEQDGIITKSGVQAEIDAWKKYKDPNEERVRFCTWEKIGVPKFADRIDWEKSFEQCAQIPTPEMVFQKRLLLSPPMPPPDALHHSNKTMNTPRNTSGGLKHRVSCATLNRIPYRDGRLLLTLNKNRLKKGVREYAPFGGAIEFLASVTLDDSLQVTLANPSDLRVYVREADLSGFEKWFRSRQGRETDPFRELREELVEEEKLVTELERSEAEFELSGLDIVDRTSSRTDAEGEWTRYFFEVFEVNLPEACWREITRNLASPGCRARLVTESEIRNGATSDGTAIAKNCLSLFRNT